MLSVVHLNATHHEMLGEIKPELVAFRNPGFIDAFSALLGLDTFPVISLRTLPSARVRVRESFTNKQTK